MSDDSVQKLCDICHERPALHHMHTFLGGESEQIRHLCAQCFERSAPPATLVSWQRLQRAIRSGKCKYCGAPAVGGSSRKNLWCRQCRDDLVEFSKRPENQLPDFDVDDESQVEHHLQVCAERDQRQKEFMRQRVSGRRQTGGLTNGSSQ